MSSHELSATSLRRYDFDAANANKSLRQQQQHKHHIKTESRQHVTDYGDWIGRNQVFRIDLVPQTSGKQGCAAKGNQKRVRQQQQQQRRRSYSVSLDNVTTSSSSSSSSSSSASKPAAAANALLAAMPLAHQNHQSNLGVAQPLALAATAASAAVMIRLFLVILICVFLVKLFAPRNNNSNNSKNRKSPSRRSSVAALSAAYNQAELPRQDNVDEQLMSDDAMLSVNDDDVKAKKSFMSKLARILHKIHLLLVQNQIIADQQANLKSSAPHKQLGLFYKSYRNSKSYNNIMDMNKNFVINENEEMQHSTAIFAASSMAQQQQQLQQQAQRRKSQAELMSSDEARERLARQQANERRRRHSDTSVAQLQLPPGPRGLPFLGYLPFVGTEIHLTLTSLSERYGPIYQIYLGGIRVVVLNDASLVRQAFKQPVFSGRPDTQLTRILQGYGIVNSDGALWKEQRAFLHTALRKLGAKSLMSGANGLEAKIQNQVKEFVNDLSGHAATGKSCQVRPMVARAVSSVVGSIVMNLTYRKYEEKEKFDRLIELMQEGFRLFMIAMPLDFIPIFRFVPGVSYAYKKMKENRAETSAFFQNVADEHRKYLSENFNLRTTSSTSCSLHPNSHTGAAAAAAAAAELAAATAAQNQGQAEQQQQQQQRTLTIGGGAEPQQPVELENIAVRDLVDAYLVQQKKHENDGKANYFSDQQLVQIMSDIFSAGLETVTSTIEWSILFLMLNQECQAQLHDEIDRVIGRERLPQLEDMPQMPYTEATIYEVLRRSNVVALGNAHAALEDASIGGYRIPKGTQVLSNLYGIHMNPRVWNQPDKFDPSRFIVNDKAQKPDHFIPFSVGRRMCLGDVLAKMEVFLFLVGILQRYELSVAPEDVNKPPQVKGTLGVSNSPASFRVVLRSRQPMDYTTTTSELHR